MRLEGLNQIATGFEAERLASIQAGLQAEHPDLMRFHGQQHLEMLIDEAAQERLAAKVEKSTPSLAQFRDELVRRARPNRRVAIKGI